MLVLLRSDVFAHKGLIVKIVFKLLEAFFSTFSLDLVEFVEPDMSHLSGELESILTVIFAVNFFSSLGQ